MALEVQIKDGKIFAPLQNKWLVLKPEEKVRQNYICHLVNHYGYQLTQMRQELAVTKSKRGAGGARADIVLWKNEEDRKNNKYPIIVVECKAENIKIQQVDYFQGSNYAAYTSAKFFITTNEKETKFFKVIEGEIPKDLDEIIDIPYAIDIENEKKINELLSQTKKFTRDEFQNLLFACHNVIRNNDKLSPEMAFDEISKILFIKIRYERSEDKLRFSLDRFNALKKSDDEIRSKNDKPFYQKLFEKTKEDFKDDEIFEENDTLRIRETSFTQIVKLLEKYNLSDTSDDVKGIAFEEFLGKTFRGDLGQFFTPRTIVDFMVQVLDPQEKELICDPCCGTGGFLIKSFEYIRENIEKEIQEKKEHIKNELIKDDFESLTEKQQKKTMEKLNNLYSMLNRDLDVQNKQSRLYNLSYRCIFGTDAEPRSARTAKMNMIMHGDGHGGVHHHDGLLNVNGIFDNRFDVLVTNPPFGARVSRDLEISEQDMFKDKDKIKYYTERYGDEYKQALEQVNGNKGKRIIDFFDTGKFSTLTEVIFLERCLRLLKKGGRLGIVLPEGFLNNSDLQKVRDFFEGKAKILLICSIPQDVFIAAGATVKPSLVFLKKFTEAEESEYNSIAEKVTKEINAKYQIELTKLNNKIKNEKDKAVKKTLNSELKELDHRIKDEIKAEIKIRFDYEIPIVQVEKAGITSTGAKCENELPEVAKEFFQYRLSNDLWKVHDKPTVYYVYDDNMTKIAFHDVCVKYNINPFQKARSV